MAKTSKISRQFVEKLQNQLELLESLNEDLSNPKVEAGVIGTKLTLWKDYTSDLIGDYISPNEGLKFHQIEELYRDSSLESLFQPWRDYLHALCEHVISSPDIVRDPSKFPKNQKAKIANSPFFERLKQHPLIIILSAIVTISGITYGIINTFLITPLNNDIEKLEKQLSICTIELTKKK